MTKDGCARVICRSASAAASGRPEVWEDIGGCSAHGEEWATLRGSVVVRLSVRDRVAVGGGRMYTAVVPRSSCEASSRGSPPSNAPSPGHLETKKHLHTLHGTAVTRPCSFLLHASLYVPVIHQIKNGLDPRFVRHQAMQIMQR